MYLVIDGGHIRVENSALKSKLSMANIDNIDYDMLVSQLGCDISFKAVQFPSANVLRR